MNALLVVVVVTVMDTWPESPLGAIAFICASLHELIAAGVEPNFTVLVLPCDGPKFAPLIVTTVPAVPVAGLMLAMLGAGGNAVTHTCAESAKRPLVQLAVAVPVVGDVMSLRDVLVPLCPPGYVAEHVDVPTVQFTA